MDKLKKKLNRKNYRKLAIQSLNNQLEKHYLTLVKAKNSKEIIYIQSEIINTYHEFIKVIQTIENFPSGAGSPGNEEIMRVCKETFIDLHTKLNRTPRPIEFKKEMMKVTNLYNEKNLERIYRIFQDENYWIHEEVKKSIK